MSSTSSASGVGRVRTHTKRSPVLALEFVRTRKGKLKVSSGHQGPPYGERETHSGLREVQAGSGAKVDQPRSYRGWVARSEREGRYPLRWWIRVSMVGETFRCPYRRRLAELKTKLRIGKRKTWLSPVVEGSLDKHTGTAQQATVRRNDAASPRPDKHANQ